MKHWLRFLFSFNFIKTAMASAAIIAVCIYFSLWWLNKATLHGSSVEVPNLKLMQLDQAMVQLDSLGLTY